MNQITIFGVGLIGGSLALALRKANFCQTIVGCGPDQAHLERAVELNVIDRYETDPTKAIVNSEILVLASPVGTFSTILSDIKDSIPESAILTDVGSCKGSVVKAARQVFGELPTRFVPAHPIAGKEKSGVEHADSSLFANHKVIVTPHENTDPTAVQTITEMWQACDAEVKSLQVEQHDQVLAATSHLPHAIAYALVETVATTDYVDEIFEFAAGGFRDSSRVASSDPTMWRDICLDNRTAILDMLKLFRDKMESLESLVESGSSDELFEWFSQSKSVRDKYFS
jgi:prephenate dehydrogenase